MAFPEESGARFKRQRAELAISLAMQSRWEEAVAANQSILSVFPSDADAYNRLGKAYIELGHYGEAREAYAKAAEMEPSNAIAKKNLARLAGLQTNLQVEAVPARVDPRLFIEEAGKAAVLPLQQLGTREVLAKVTAGDQVQLEVEGRQLKVITLSGEYLGQLEPRLGSRLLTLMDSGNRYEAAVTSVGEEQTKVIIREIYQAPQMAGRLSFPSRTETGVRPYIKESIVQYGLEDEDEELEEDEESAEWEGEGGEDSQFVAQSLPTEADDDEEDEDS